MKELKNIKINKNNKEEKYVSLETEKYENINQRKNFNNESGEQFKNFLFLDRLVIIKKFKIFNIKKNKKHLYYFLITLCFSLIYLLYGLSLEKCIEGIDKCGIKYNWIKRKIKQEICSSILMGIMIQFIIFGNISRKHLIHIP